MNKKGMMAVAVLGVSLSLATPAFASDNHVFSQIPAGGPRLLHHVSVGQGQSTTATSRMTTLIQKPQGNGAIKPNLTSTSAVGDGGTATITLMESDVSFSWSVKPSWFGPYYYNVNVVIEKQSGAYVTESSFSGLSIGGTHSDVTGSYAYLPAGSYYAILEGYCDFDPGVATIENPKIPFYMY